MGDSAITENKDNIHPVPGLYILASTDIFNMLEKVKIIFTFLCIIDNIISLNIEIYQFGYRFMKYIAESFMIY